eukprot:3467000-Rhodomonas_salina.2
MRLDPLDARCGSTLDSSRVCCAFAVHPDTVLILVQWTFVRDPAKIAISSFNYQASQRPRKNFARAASNVLGPDGDLIVGCGIRMEDHRDLMRLAEERCADKFCRAPCARLLTGHAAPLESESLSVPETVSSPTMATATGALFDQHEVSLSFAFCALPLSLLSLSPVLPHPPLLSTQLSASACFNQPGISSLSSSWPHSRLVPGCLHALAPPSLPPAATLDIVPAELGGMQLEEENEAAAAAGAAAAGFDMRPGARFWVQGASSGGARAQASRTCRAQARGSRPPHPRCPGSPARRAVRRSASSNLGANPTNKLLFPASLVVLQAGVAVHASQRMTCAASVAGDPGRGRTRAGAADAQQPRPVSVPAGSATLLLFSSCMVLCRCDPHISEQALSLFGRRVAACGCQDAQV